MYKSGGGGAVIGGGALAYTGAPVFAYALAGVLLLLVGVLAYRISATRA